MGFGVYQSSMMISLINRDDRNALEFVVMAISSTITLVVLL